MYLDDNQSQALNGINEETELPSSQQFLNQAEIVNHLSKKSLQFGQFNQTNPDESHLSKTLDCTEN